MDNVLKTVSSRFSAKSAKQKARLDKQVVYTNFAVRRHTKAALYAGVTAQIQPFEPPKAENDGRRDTLM